MQPRSVSTGEAGEARQGKEFSERARQLQRRPIARVSEAAKNEEKEPFFTESPCNSTGFFMGQ
jgi:hypothetical protein